jgi:methyl-accepting chemotaxis protein
MKNISIRTRILVGVVAINVIGALLVVVYLHQSYSGGLDVSAQSSATLGLAAWEQISELGADELGAITATAPVGDYLGRMKAITGSDYGLLLDKSTVDQKAFEAAREAAGLASNWDDRETYVLVAATDEALGEKMQLKAAPADIDPGGRIVGVENGACSQTCHGAVKGTGDFWAVAWSTDSKSRSHAVFPVSDEAGKPIGVIYSIADISPQADSAKNSMIQTLVVFGITLFIATLAIGGMLDVWVFRRLSRMITTMEELSVRVAGGDFSVHFDPSGSNDEIGRFEQFFSRFLDLVSATLKSVIGG